MSQFKSKNISLRYRQLSSATGVYIHFKYISMSLFRFRLCRLLHVCEPFSSIELQTCHKSIFCLWKVSIPLLRPLERFWMPFQFEFFILIQYIRFVFLLKFAWRSVFSMSFYSIQNQIGIFLVGMDVIAIELFV